MDDIVEVPASLRQEMQECKTAALLEMKRIYQCKDSLMEVDAVRFQAVVDELDSRGYRETWGDWMQRIKEQHRALHPKG